MANCHETLYRPRGPVAGEHDATSIGGMTVSARTAEHSAVSPLFHPERPHGAFTARAVRPLPSLLPAYGFGHLVHSNSELIVQRKHI
jgi:hypothetical protein